LSSLCSSLKGVSSAIQLKIDSYQPVQACPWKFNNVAYARVYYTVVRKKGTFKLFVAR
jgi:hypothetical protein